MRIYIAVNINKQHGIVNGESAKVLDVKGKHIIEQLSNGTTHFITEQYDEEAKIAYFPFIPDYCLTIYRVQGETLQGINLWLDRELPTPGAAYVAFSRVPQFEKVILLEELNRFQICPIKTGQLLEDH